MRGSEGEGRGKRKEGKEGRKRWRDEKIKTEWNRGSHRIREERSEKEGEIIKTYEQRKS